MARKTKAELEAEAEAAALALAELEAAGDHEGDEPDGEESELDALMRQAAEEGEDVGDDEVDIDLSEAATFEPFTDKNVPIEITTASRKVGKDSGAPYLELKVRVFEGEHAKRVLWTNINLTGKGAGFGIDKLAAFGATSKDGTPISSKNTKLYLPGLVGLKALAECAPDEREEYKTKVVIGKIKPYGDADEDEVENLK